MDISTPPTEIQKPNNFSKSPLPPLNISQKVPILPSERKIRMQEFEQDALRDRIDKISTRIALDKRARADFTIPVSPLIALPDEAIRGVLIFVCHDTPVAKHAPILLCRVCRRWRTIALSCPALWSVIRVSGRHSAQLLELFLKRSRHLTLKGFLDLVTGSSSHLATATIRALLPSIARFSQLHLKFPDNGVERQFIKALQGLELPALQTLELCSDDIEDPWEDEEDQLLNPLILRHLVPSSLRIDTRSLIVLQPNISSLHTLQIEGGSNYSRLSFSRLIAMTHLLTRLSIGSGVLKDISEVLVEMLGVMKQYKGPYLPNLTHFRCADPRLAPTID
ncbi:hypothetical protein CPB83DRAFT_350131 [Crepidotus variabilis]|uniref:F-box domain-containing protein n=1 Tax=Crepidotus variabilis TaxID=179855 RepID=A0A9P6EEV1_9AGAR|nr:hypothetical protein CPB83DRAFT_350131 [Crepidotus variabilis]